MTSRFADDTALDAIASQVRSAAVLAEAEVADLLEQARGPAAGAARERLLEHQLSTVLAAVLARRGAGLELPDLYQEGSMAAAIAVDEYAVRGGAAAGLTAYVAAVVDTGLDEVVARETARRVADALLVERVKLLEIAEVSLRRRLGRQPTILEIAAALEWTPDEVGAVTATLNQARSEYDAGLLEFLDDIDDAPGDGG